MKLRTQSLRRHLTTYTLMKEKQVAAAAAGVVVLVLLVLRECEISE
jgi:hypothetical protein